MAKKKRGSVCFCLPNWKNPVAGKSVYLYTAGLLYQLMAWFAVLEYSDASRKNPPLQLTVFGWTDKEAMYDGEQVSSYYYQDEGLMVYIVFSVFWALIINVMCLLVAAKGALGPAKSDKKVMPKVATLGFIGWLFGIISMALFAPGENGDIVNETTGFYCQLLGLSLMLGGVIVQFDCAAKLSVDHSFRAMTAVNPV